MAEVGNSAVKPALGDFVHPRAHLVVGVGKLARVPELADHRPVVGADRMRLASAVCKGVVDTDAAPSQRMIRADTSNFVGSGLISAIFRREAGRVAGRAAQW